MGASMRIDVKQKDDLTTQVVTGDVDAEEVILAIERFYAGRPTTKVLWDLSFTSFSKISSADVVRIANLTRQFADRRESGKTALVFSGNVGFGFGRMFGTLQEVKDSPVQHRSFRSKEEALRWLSE